MRTFEETWYRGSGALRLGAKVYHGEWAVWLEMARSLPGKEKGIPREGGHKYAWEHKVVFRLSREDLGKIGWALESAAGKPETGKPASGEILALIHQYQGRQKRLQIILAANGVLFINAQESGRKVEVPVPLAEDGIWKLRQCIRLAYEEAVCQMENGSAEPAI